MTSGFSAAAQVEIHGSEEELLLPKIQLGIRQSTLPQVFRLGFDRDLLLLLIVQSLPENGNEFGGRG